MVHSDNSGNNSSNDDGGDSGPSFSDPVVVDPERTPDFRDNNDNDSEGDSGGDSGGDIQNNDTGGGGNDSDSTAVVVTENKDGEQVTVGQGTDTEAARIDAATNPDFDAAQGEEVDAFESALDSGQGDGTDASALVENNNQRDAQQQGTRQTKDKPNFFEQNIQDAIQTQKGIAARNRREQQIIRENAVDFVPDFVPDVIENNVPKGFVSNKGRTVRGVQGLRAAETITRETREAIPDSVEVPATNAATRTIETATEIAAENTDNRAAEKASQGIDTFKESAVAGVPAGPVALGSLFTAGTGAVPLALRQDTPSLQTGAVKGAELTGEEIAENPARFAGTEAGEEIGEAAGGALIGGAAGATIGAVPTVTPEFTPNVRTRVRDTARTLKSSVTDPNAAGSLAGSFVPPENKPGPGRTPGPVTQPDPVTVQEVTGRNINTQVQTEPKSEPEPTVQQETGFDIPSNTRPIVDSVDNTVSQPDSITEPEPVTETRPETRVETEPRTEPQTRVDPTVQTRTEPIAETRVRPETDPRIENEFRPESRPTPRNTGDQDNREELFPTLNDKTTNENAADTPSIDAILLGIEEDSDNKKDETEVFTGFETRPLEEDSDVLDLL